MNQLITNGIEIKQRILFEINNSSKSIYLAMAYFTDRDIANAIINAKNRNVVVDIVLSSNVNNEVVKKMFIDSNVSVHAFDTGDDRGIMHHKFCLIDGRISINGSYNYSFNASNNNVENITVSDDINIYNQFLEEFERIKYNIDHKIDISSTQKIINNPEVVAKPLEENQSLNFQDQSLKEFKDVLDNIIATEVGSLDKTLLKNSGYNRAQENNGDHQVLHQAMDSLYSNFINEIEVIDEKKNRLKSKIEEQLKITIGNLETKTENEINSVQNNAKLNNQSLIDKKLELEKLIQEKDSKIKSNETSIIPFLKEKIQNIQAKIDELKIDFIKPPINWFQSILLIFFFVLFVGYIFIFYSSVAYIFIFSKEDILKALNSGILNNETPEVFNAHAITKIWNKGAGGIMFLFLFVAIPLALGMFKYLVDTGNDEKENVKDTSKLTQFSKKWGGLLLIFIVDAFIAYKVSKNINDIEYYTRVTDKQKSFFEMLGDGNFWLVFILGSLGIYLFSLIFEKLMNSVNKRNTTLHQSKTKGIVENLNTQINTIKEEINNINIENINLKGDINTLERDLNVIKVQIEKLPIDENEKINTLKQKLLSYVEKATNLANIFKSQVDNDKLPISKAEMENRVNIFMEGWSKYLHEYFSISIAESKTEEAIAEIEMWLNNLSSESKLD